MMGHQEPVKWEKFLRRQTISQNKSSHPEECRISVLTVFVKLQIKFQIVNALMLSTLSCQSKEIAVDSCRQTRLW